VDHVLETALYVKVGYRYSWGDRGEDILGVSLEQVEDWSRTESTKWLQFREYWNLWDPAGFFFISFFVLFLVLLFSFLLFSWPGVWKGTISAP
jgi:hypothetical protein